MEFVLEQQAKFYTDIGSINGAITKINEAITKINEAITKINGTLAKHNEAIVGLVQVSRTLVDHQIAMDAQMAELGSGVNGLRSEMEKMARAHRESDERLSAFITLMERYLRGRNGGKKNR